MSGGALGLNAWLTPVCRWHSADGVHSGRWVVATSAQAPAQWRQTDWATVCAELASQAWPSVADLKQAWRTWADAQAWLASPVGSSAVVLQWHGNGERSVSQHRAELGTSLDRLALLCAADQPDPRRLTAAIHEAPVSETLWTRRWCLGGVQGHDLRWRYSGPQWEQVGLLNYLAGFASSPLDLPSAVDQVFKDVRSACKSLQCQVWSYRPLPQPLWSTPEALPDWCGELGAWRTDHPAAAPHWA